MAKLVAAVKAGDKTERVTLCVSAGKETQRGVIRHGNKKGQPTTYLGEALVTRIEGGPRTTQTVYFAASGTNGMRQGTFYHTRGNGTGLSFLLSDAKKAGEPFLVTREKGAIKFSLQYKEYEDKPTATVPKPADLSQTGDEVDNNDTEKETPPMNRPASAF